MLGPILAPAATMTDTRQPRVCLAISSFRNDESVLRLLEASVDSTVFAHILVVDSVGTGVLATEVERRGWTKRVQYINSPENLGSAGNLARRLELAAAAGQDWVYAVNHDGVVDPAVVSQLVACGESRPNIAAVYPLHYKTGRKEYNLTGRWSLPVPFRGERARPSPDTIEVFWGSSNMALYSLQPVRAGLLPWADLWMGWEDLGYGWLLHRRGYRQVLLTTVEAHDSYEYAQHRAFGRPFTVTSKPSWYAYYQARNLILVTRRARQPWTHWATVAGRLMLEAALTTAVRPEKRVRFRLLARGTLDGLRNHAGKWRVP